MKEKIKKILNLVWKYSELITYTIIFPLIVGCMYLEQLLKDYNDSIWDNLITYTISILFVCYTFFFIYEFFRTFKKKDEIIWPIVTVIALIIISAVLLFGSGDYYSIWLIIICIIIFELHLLYKITYCISKNKSLNKILVYSILFLVVGFYSIYDFTFSNNNDLYNSLITIFSSIIGGGLTLGGVAWTITDSKNSKMEEDKLKYKPLFTILDIYSNSIRQNCRKLIVEYEEKLKYEEIPNKIKEDEKLYYIDLIYLKNSDNSNFVIDEIEICDLKWNNKEKFLVNKNEEFLISDILFFILKKDELPTIKIKVKDVLNNIYTYELKYEIHESNFNNKDVIKYYIIKPQYLEEIIKKNIEK